MKTIQLLTLLTISLLLSQCVVSRVQKKVSDKIDNFPYFTNIGSSGFPLLSR
jgi:hypothetical protein